MVVGDYGARNELREHGYVSTVVYQVLLGLCLASVYVNDVGDVLEGVEADTDREDYILHGKALVEEMVDVLRAEGPVFEEYEPPEVEKYAEGQPQFLQIMALLDELPDYEVQQDSQQEQHYVNGFPHAEAVKNDASRKYYKIAIFHLRCGVCFLEKEEYRQQE